MLVKLMGCFLICFHLITAFCGLADKISSNYLTVYVYGYQSCYKVFFYPITSTMLLQIISILIFNINNNIIFNPSLVD